MVEIALTYNGHLRCTATHGPSGTSLITDPPVDNQGRGESFSPTDLLATALGSCMMTYVGITAKKHGWDLQGTTMRVEKHMVADPLRRVGKLAVTIYLPVVATDEMMRSLMNAVTTCPVKLSISERIDVPVEIIGR